MAAPYRKVVFRNPLAQELGLRFRKPAPDTLYVFAFGRQVRKAFSMWFVFSPLDVFFLDGQRRVVDMKKGFAPFTTYRPRTPYTYAVETRPGLLAVKSGDRLPC